MSAPYRVRANRRDIQPATAYDLGFHDPQSVAVIPRAVEVGFTILALTS